MSDKKKSNVLLKGTTPAGIAIYPWLGKPDTKFNKDGEYRIKLKLEGEAAATFKAKLEELHGTAVAKMEKEVTEAMPPAKRKAFKMKVVDAPFKPVFDDEGNETDAIEVTFKQKAVIKLKDGPKEVGPIALFDAKGKPFKGAVYGGSKVKVAFEALPFYGASIGAGLTLRLGAVQVLELVTGGQQSAAGYGFGEEEGFEADEHSGDAGDEGGEDSDGEGSEDF